MKHYIRLPLENAFNVRDLGGYACSGGVTGWGRLLRSDSLTQITRKEVDFLLAYGVRTIIDLRGEQECVCQPEPPALLEAVQYRTINLGGEAVQDVTRYMTETPAQFLPDFYVSLLFDRGHCVRKVLEAVADAPKGAVLFHCAAGKDRTGVIAALLLGIAGVCKADILSNYQVTYTYLQENVQLQAYAGEYPQELMHSRKEYLEYAMDAIAEKHTSIHAYVESIGVSPGTVTCIRNRFIES